MHLTELLSTFHGLDHIQRTQLGLEHLSYDQITHFVVRVEQLVTTQRCDVVDLMNGIFAHTVPQLEAMSLAVDSTDYETHARIRSFWSKSDPAPDNHEDEQAPVVDELPATRSSGFPVLEADNRLRRTADLDARDGHRSARDNRAAGPFVGYDLTLAVNACGLGEAAAPGFIAAANLTAAGSHHAQAALAIIKPTAAGRHVTDVVADRAYNSARPEYWTLALRTLDIEPVFDLTVRQRGTRPGPSPHTILVDGIICADSLPEYLRDLPYPKHLDALPEDERIRIRQRHEERLNYSYRSMGRTAAGAIRYRGPIRADGASPPIRCPNNPMSMRAAQDRPTTSCKPEGCGCSATVTVPDTFQPNLRQRSPYGSRRWARDYGRRNAVESANSALRTEHGLKRSYTRVLGLVKTAFLLGFTIFAYNQARIIGHFASRGLPIPDSYRIAHRADLIAHTPESSPTPHAAHGPPGH